MLQTYRLHAAERAALGIPPLPLDAQQTADVIELLKNPPAGEDAFLLDLLVNRVPAGVDDAAKVKASYLAALAFGSETNPLIPRARATELLGTMLGGYNVAPLVQLLDDAEIGSVAANALDLVRRQIADGDRLERESHARLRALLGHDGQADALERELCERIRERRLDASTPGLMEHLMASTLAKMSIDQPSYASYRRALANKE